MYKQRWWHDSKSPGTCHTACSFLHVASWIKLHIQTLEKLDSISFLVLFHHESFVNLNALTYIIIFSFKVDFQHQRDNIAFEVAWDWIDHCLTHSLRFCHNDIRQVMWIKRLELNSFCLCSLSNFNQNVMLCHFPSMWTWQLCYADIFVAKSLWLICKWFDCYTQKDYQSGAIT